MEAKDLKDVSSAGRTTAGCSRSRRRGRSSSRESTTAKAAQPDAAARSRREGRRRRRSRRKPRKKEDEAEGRARVVLRGRSAATDRSCSSRARRAGTSSTSPTRRDAQILTLDPDERGRRARRSRRSAGRPTARRSSSPGRAPTMGARRHAAADRPTRRPGGVSARAARQGRAALLGDRSCRATAARSCSAVGRRPARGVCTRPTRASRTCAGSRPQSVAGGRRRCRASELVAYRDADGKELYGVLRYPVELREGPEVPDRVRALRDVLRQRLQRAARRSSRATATRCSTRR